VLLLSGRLLHRSHVLFAGGRFALGDLFEIAIGRRVEDLQALLSRRQLSTEHEVGIVDILLQPVKLHRGE